MNLPEVGNKLTGKIAIGIEVLILLSLIAYQADLGSSGQKYRCQDCNVVVVSVDPVRADRMGVYGYERNTTPFLSSMAEESLIFENTFAQSSHTLTSLFSTFTGKYPSGHGVKPSNAEEAGFSQNFTMLAERLDAEGYETSGVAGEVNVKGRYGFRRGFDSYDSSHWNYNGKDDDIGKILDPVEDEKFFLFYQTYLLHDPYIPEESYSGSFEGFVPSFREKMLKKRNELRKSNLSSQQKYRRLKNYYFERVRNNETLRKHARSEYDSGVKNADAVVRRLFKELEERGLANETIVVVTSQHGEMLGEYGVWRHHKYLYTETLKVPLIIHMPSGAHKRVGAPVEMIDLSPTILDIVGADNGTVESQGAGKSLLSIVKDNRKAERFVFAEGVNHEMKTLLDTREKLRYFVDTVKQNESLYRLTGNYSDSRRLNDTDLMGGMRELYAEFISKLPERDGVNKATRPYFASES